MKEGILYEFADREGFINRDSANKKIADVIDCLGGKFKIFLVYEGIEANILNHNGSVIENTPDGGVCWIDHREFEFFQPVVDSEVPLKQPTVTYVYDEKKVEEGLKQILEENDHELFDDLFYMSAPDAAKVLSEKLKPFLLN